jgi:hypothetical protein
MTCQRFVVVAGRLQTKDHFCQTILSLDLVGGSNQPRKTVQVIFKDQFAVKRNTGRGAHEGVVFIFAYINPDDKVLIRPVNLFDDLTILSAPDNFLVAHDNLLLAFCGLFLVAPMLSGGYLFFYAIINFLFTTL